MTDSERQALLETYRTAPARLAAAIDTLRPEEIDGRPSAEDWTVREIVHHLADAEIISAARLRAILHEDNPSLVAFDEAGYARRFDYGERPFAGALALLTTVRQSNVEIMERMAPDEWERAGDHPEYGRYTIARLLETHAPHAPAHIRQIEANRDALRAGSA
ncbi:MAG TPA: DinB family protein [Thermomicrobiales bacterium]|nr:DinB family protein [Thermomicrobiales bacterium]